MIRSKWNLDSDVQNDVVGHQQPVCRPLEQDPPTERQRRFPSCCRDHPVEVVPRQVHARRENLTGGSVVVQGLGQRVDERREGVGCRVHAVILAHVATR